MEFAAEDTLQVPPAKRAYVILGLGAFQDPASKGLFLLRSQQLGSPRPGAILQPRQAFTVEPPNPLP
jgi:hypothetical protein